MNKTFGVFYVKIFMGVFKGKIWKIWLEKKFKVVNQK